MLEKHWNQGIITEACCAVIAHARLDGLSYLTATHDVNNVFSGCVMKKLGMTYKYTYQEQWMPKNYPVMFRMYQINLKSNQDTYMEYWNKSEVKLIESI